MNSVDDINSALFFQMDDGGRRRHDKKLFKRRFRHDVRKYVFSNRVVNNWNSLPALYVNCCNINTFKKGNGYVQAHLYPVAYRHTCTLLWGLHSVQCIVVDSTSEIFLESFHSWCLILRWYLMHYGQHRDQQQAYLFLAIWNFFFTCLFYSDRNGGGWYWFDWKLARNSAVTAHLAHILRTISGKQSRFLCVLLKNCR